MNIRITTLSENTAQYGFLAEWGLSILVETGNLNILVDTGMTFTALHNSEQMKIDLSKINYIFLSHGHCDHTGGLLNILQKSRNAQIIAHPDIWTERYTIRDGKSREQYIGIPFTREDLKDTGAKLILTTQPFYFNNNITSTGEIPMVTDYEQIEDNLLVKESGKLHPDPIRDDGALIINNDYGLVIITGCTHHGIINTIYRAQKLTGNENVYAIIGGLHLFRASRERIEITIKEFKRIGIKKLAVSHCTGFYALAPLSQEFGSAFFLNNAGSTFELP